MALQQYQLQMPEVYVTVNEEKMRNAVLDALVDSLNEKTINVSGAVGAAWSGFYYTEWDEEGNPTKAERTPGTHKKITGIVGEIDASRNGTNINVDITYTVQLATLN